jgi:GNAT superfamily N-acetyltransferase
VQFIPPERRGRAEDRRPGEHLLSFREGTGRWLDASSERVLQELLEACREDLRLAVGGEPDAEEARALLLERPAGLAPDQRLVLGLYDEAGRLIAALDAYRDFPDPGTWFLALILVHPTMRGRSIATGLLARLERFAAGEGALEIHSVAPGHNPAIRQFMRRCGFVPAREVDLSVESRTVRGLLLVRALSPAVTA